MDEGGLHKETNPDATIFSAFPQGLITRRLEPYLLTTDDKENVVYACQPF